MSLPEGAYDLVIDGEVVESLTEEGPRRRLADWQELVERTLDEALAGLPVGNDPAPALAALERARTAWARVHDQLSLEL